VTASIVSVTVSPVNSRAPVTSSYRSTPTEKTSERASSGRPRICSGDMYENFPFKTPAWVCSA